MNLSFMNQKLMFWFSNKTFQLKLPFLPMLSLMNHPLWIVLIAPDGFADFSCWLKELAF